jgi:serine/threonine-protein kinase
LEKPVAIKEILPDLLQDAKTIDMFQDEAINTAKLTHPNIVQVYNLRKTVDNKFYIIMEYIDGVDLAHLMKKIREEKCDFPLYLKAAIVDYVAQALDYAHNKVDPLTANKLNIVHRDVSPSNIMITADGIVKLIDFGIAKAKFSRSEKTRKGVIKGKISYMSPEQVLGNVDLDGSSDIFSLGIIFYELLTGKKPFEGKSDFSVMEAVVKAKYDRKKLESVSEPVIIDIINKALKKKIENRYQSASEMHNDIANYLHLEKVINPTKELSNYVLTLFKQEIQKDYSDQISKFDDKAVNIKTMELASASTPSDHFVKQIAAQEQRTGEKVVEPVIEHKPGLQPKPEQEEEEKTIFDIIRLSRRNLKKYRLPIMIVFFFLLIFGAYLDFRNGWTFFGKWIYSKIYPFSLTIESVPSEAEIILDDEYLNKNTPVTLPNLDVGSHKIELRLAGFDPVIVSYVVSRDKNKGPLLIHFTSTLNIISKPEDANVYINDRKLPNKTPCSFEYLVGDTISLAIEKTGFFGLDDFTFFTLEGKADTYDSRYWEIKKTDRMGYSEYLLIGTFQKHVTIRSYPQGADIYIDGNKLKDVKTNTKINLTVGEHKVEMKKSPFRQVSFMINVNEELESVSRSLKRPIMIKSYSLTDKGEGDLGAIIKRAENMKTWTSKRIDRSTPYQHDFYYYDYRLYLSKEGYNDTSIVFHPRSGQAVAYLRRENPKLLIIVENYEKFPISRCMIGYKKEGITYFSSLGRTNADGVFRGALPIGDYILQIDKSGYKKIEEKMNISYSKENKIIIVLEKEN